MSTEKSNKNHVFIYKESGDPNMRHSQPTDCKERQTYWYKNWKTRTLEYLFSEQSVLEQVDENTNRKKKTSRKLLIKSELQYLPDFTVYSRMQRRRNQLMWEVHPPEKTFARPGVRMSEKQQEEINSLILILKHVGLLTVSAFNCCTLCHYTEDQD